MTTLDLDPLPPAPARSPVPQPPTSLPVPQPPERPPVAWHPLRLGQTTGYVILVRPSRHRPDEAQPGAYWCGHAGWERFVGCLEYRDLHTGRPCPAAVAVYGTAWGAVRSWHTYLTGYHRRNSAAYPAAFEVLPLSIVPDRGTVPRWRHLHPISTAEASARRRRHGAAHDDPSTLPVPPRVHHRL